MTGEARRSAGSPPGKAEIDKITFARRLRKDQTNAERLLWFKLRNFQLMKTKFRRQQVIDQYIVDFVSFEHRLIIELDGGQHNTEEGIKSDIVRTHYLESKGFKVIRFWDNDILLQSEDV